MIEKQRFPHWAAEQLVPKFATHLDCHHLYSKGLSTRVGLLFSASTC